MKRSHQTQYLPAGLALASLLAACGCASSDSSADPLPPEEIEEIAEVEPAEIEEVEVTEAEELSLEEIITVRVLVVNMRHWYHST